MRGHTLRNGAWKKLTGSRVLRRSGTKSGYVCVKCGAKVRPWRVVAHEKRHAE